MSGRKGHTTKTLPQSKKAREIIEDLDEVFWSREIAKPRKIKTANAR